MISYGHKMIPQPQAYRGCHTDTMVEKTFTQQLSVNPQTGPTLVITYWKHILLSHIWYNPPFYHL